MRTLTTDYARNLASLADSIERAPESPDIRAAWVAALQDTCPLHRSSTARRVILETLEAVGVESPPQRKVDLLRVLSYVVKRSPV